MALGRNRQNRIMPIKMAEKSSQNVADWLHPLPSSNFTAAVLKNDNRIVVRDKL
jgi:hypothetical protein